MDLIPCPGCGCHVRAGEEFCPHCAVALPEAAAPRAVARGLLDTPRVAIAAALAGMVPACGGQVAGDQNQGAATEADVAGSCAVDGGDVPCASVGGCRCGPAGMCAEAASGPSVGCRVGPANMCVVNACLPVPCAQNEYVNHAGECVSIYWFEGKVPSTHACYGAPPARG
jgi:hypothetical protein